MNDARKTQIIAPTLRDVEVWRLTAEEHIKPGFGRPAEFNWPEAVLSLCQAWRHHNGKGILWSEIIAIKLQIEEHQAKLFHQERMMAAYEAEDKRQAERAKGRTT